jgi:hypothetical protein
MSALRDVERSDKILKAKPGWAEFFLSIHFSL